MNDDDDPRMPFGKFWTGMGTSLALMVLAGIQFVLGIWIDSRWAGTGAIFFIPGLIGAIIVGLMAENGVQPRLSKETRKRIKRERERIALQASIRQFERENEIDGN